jgi:hypothetical protein
LKILRIIYCIAPEGYFINSQYYGCYFLYLGNVLRREIEVLQALTELPLDSLIIDFLPQNLQQLQWTQC